MSKVRIWWDQHPLQFVLILGAIFRLISAIFSKGYGMHDDHFLIVEAAQSWIDGRDYNNWLPANSDKPSGHSMFYVGLHYLFFLGLKKIGIVDPQFKMFLVRFLHGTYSLLVIYLGFKITLLFSQIRVAKIVGVLLGTLWFIPILSVRNLTELVCIPPLMAATWLLIKNRDHIKLTNVLLAGLLCGVSMALRIQTVLFIGGLGLVLLSKQKWKETILLGLMTITGLFITQITDLFTWGYPFAEISEYITYNVNNKTTYGILPWYTYMLTIMGILIPPVSVFLFWGFLKEWKRLSWIVVPSLIFLVFHSYFPNKQERFIVPILPFIIIGGMVGLYHLSKTISFFSFENKFYKGSWYFFAVVNLILLLLVSPAYTKKSRVEAMTYMSKKDKLGHYFMDFSHNDEFIMQPLYYIKSWKEPNIIHSATPENHLKKVLPNTNGSVNYILFYENENIDKRVKRIKAVYSNITLETIIEPSLIDKTLHFLNPRNKNEQIFVYRVD